MKNKKIYLRTTRLELHSFRANDLENALAIFYNEEIKKTYMLPDFPSRENAIALFDRLMRLSNNVNRFVYGIYKDEDLIGFINDVEITSSTIEVGYVIHPDYQNQGYMTEALKACIEELFRIGYTTVKAGHFEENIADYYITFSFTHHGTWYYILLRQVFDERKEYICHGYRYNSSALRYL